MVPTPLILDGVYRIRNGQFTNRVADLYGEQHEDIVGAMKRPSNMHDQVCVVRGGGLYSLLL